MPLAEYLDKVKTLISNNDLDEAITMLRQLLENSKQLDEVIQQSGRYAAIRQQIRLGTVSHKDATLTQNQIRQGLLDLLQEITQQAQKPAIKEEMEHLVVVIGSKNTVVDSPLTAGGNIHMGDIFYGAERKIPHALTSNPFIPEIFLGRETDLAHIHHLLFQEDHLLLLVNGNGGVGKTSLAAKYFLTYQHEYAHVAWVFSERSIAEAMLLVAIPLGLQFGETMTTQERLDMLLVAMANLKKPCLLVLDNANDLPDLDANYQRLRRCANFHLLLTTRITQFGQAQYHHIGGLPEAEALALFEKHYRPLPPDEKALFVQIREAVNGNTLVLELLAKNLMVLNTGLKTRYTLTDLLADLQGKGLLNLSQTREVSVDYQSPGQMRHEKPEAIIGAMYDLGGLSKEEVVVLSAFAVLPAESLAFEILEVLLPKVPDLDTLLLGLAQKGWIEYHKENAAFKCNPVVQEITRVKNMSLRMDCQSLVDVLNEKLDYETISTRYLLNSTDDEALYFSSYAASILDNFSNSDWHLGLLNERLGNYYEMTGSFDQALRYFEQYRQTQNDLCQIEPDNIYYKNSLAISYEKLGDINNVLGNLNISLDYFELYNQIEKELHERDPQNVHVISRLALSNSRLGDAHRDLGNLDKALFYYHERSRLGKELYEINPQDINKKSGLAISFSRLGDIYMALEDFENARQNFEQYNQLEKELYESNPKNQGIKNGLAISFDRLGDVYTAQSNLTEALLCFEQYYELNKELYKNSPEHLGFKNGYAVSNGKLGNAHMVIGNMNEALVFFDFFLELMKELFESYPKNVSYKNGLAVSYSQLGQFYQKQKTDLAKAKFYFNQCYLLWEELATEFKNHAQFRQNFEWVKGVLEELEGG